MKKIFYAAALTAVPAILALAFLTSCATQKTDEWGTPVVQHEKTDRDYFNDANEAFGQGRLEDAVKLYDKATSLNPAFETAYVSMAFTLGKLGRDEEALAAFDKVTLLDPDSPTAYIAKGHIMIILKRYDDALAELEKALARDAGSRPARTNKALALLKRGKGDDAEKAKKMLEQVIAENGKDVAAARAYAMLQNKEYMVALVKYLATVAPIVKTYIGTDIEFEAYWNDPDFKAALKGEQQ